MRAFITIFILLSLIAVFYINQTNDELADNAYIVKGLAHIRQLFTGKDDTSSSKTSVYKFKDQDGNWVFTDQAPVPINDANQVDIYSDTNLIPALRKKQLQDLEKKNEPVETKKEGYPSKDEQPHTTPDINGLKQLIQDTKSIEGTLQQRKQQQDKIINQE